LAIEGCFVTTPTSQPVEALHPVLAAESLRKSFGAAPVLIDLSLTLYSGEVHAIIGENGAGKSTLAKLLAGHEQPDHGRVLLDGEPTRFSGPADAEHRGIVLVHQELLLAGQMTVAENLFLGRERRRGPFLDRTAMRISTAQHLARLGCAIHSDMRVDRLSIADRQMVQITRALLIPHRAVIFDEPTAVLTPVETAALFRVIAELKASGTGILFISHRLAEVAAIADRVTVLRDGRHVATHPAVDLSQPEMARLMVGREMSALFPDKPPAPTGPVVLEISGASVPGFVADAGFSLRAGEILGFAGLVGAGRTELFEGLLGLRPARIGKVLLEGCPHSLPNPRAAIEAGIGYLTEDRKGKGLLLRHDLAFNLTLAAEHRLRGLPLVDAAREHAALSRALGDFDIRVGRHDALAGQLSGGNQQKLLFAKTMLRQPRILVIDEPTRGIDIGTRAQIYRFIASLARDGVSCVIISSEMQELIGLCHRILVMRAGRIVAELQGEEMTEHTIVMHATGVAEPAA
jgi:ribose transport system ATP-binding protein